MLKLTERMQKFGWVIRPAMQDSDVIFVRGSLPHEKHNNGFVYAESVEEAEALDESAQ